MDSGCLLLTEQSQSEKTIYDSNHVTFWNRQNYGHNNIGDCQKTGEGRGA